MYLDSRKYLRLINKRNTANVPKFLRVVKSFPSQMTFIYTMGNSDREITIKVLEIQTWDIPVISALEPEAGGQWTEGQSGPHSGKRPPEAMQGDLAQANIQKFKNEIIANSPLSLCVDSLIRKLCEEETDPSTSLRFSNIYLFIFYIWALVFPPFTPPGYSP